MSEQELISFLSKAIDELGWDVVARSVADMLDSHERSVDVKIP